MQKIQFFFMAFLLPLGLMAQVYSFTEGPKTHRVFMDESYLVETVFNTEDGFFILSRGGYFTIEKDRFKVQFEFNSNFEKDSLTYKKYDRGASWKNISTLDQNLEGKWLMAGRVKPEGEQRRDLTRSRKTMKILLNGYFQWIAFDTANMSFKGTGGGTYTAKDGAYVETLDYFSRDPQKVGKVLPFEYRQNKDDWYHKGFTSKGEPMHEIWHKRN